MQHFSCKPHHDTEGQLVLAPLWPEGSIYEIIRPYQGKEVELIFLFQHINNTTVWKLAMYSIFELLLCLLSFISTLDILVCLVSVWCQANCSMAL